MAPCSALFETLPQLESGPHSPATTLGPQGEQVEHTVSIWALQMQEGPGAGVWSLGREGEGPPAA